MQPVQHLTGPKPDVGIDESTGPPRQQLRREPRCASACRRTAFISPESPDTITETRGVGSTPPPPPPSAAIEPRPQPPPLELAGSKPAPASEAKSFFMSTAAAASPGGAPE